MGSSGPVTGRAALSRRAVVDAAARVADGGGLAAVSMRNVGRELGVEAMSLYHHVADKSDLLDGLADWIFAAITLPEPGQEWRTGMTVRATSARQVLARHPWGLGLIESRRSPGPALLRHHDAVLGCLRAGGFGVAPAAHAFSVIDAYVYGFVLTELNLPFSGAHGDGAAEFAAGLELVASSYPHLAEMITELVVGGDYDFADEFDHGLTLILDALAASLSAAVSATRARDAPASTGSAAPRDR